MLPRRADRAQLSTSPLYKETLALAVQYFQLELAIFAVLAMTVLVVVSSRRGSSTAVGARTTTAVQ